MTEEKRPASRLRRMGCVSLLGVGVFFLWASTFNTGLGFAMKWDLDLTLSLVIVLPGVLGLVAIWIGTRVCERWPTRLAFFFALFGGLNVTSSLGAWAHEWDQAQRQIKLPPGVIEPAAPPIWLLIIGIAFLLLGLLIFLRRRHTRSVLL